MADFHDHPEADEQAGRPARSTWNSRERIPPGALDGSAERTRLDAEQMLSQLDTLQSQLNRAGSEAERMQRLAMLGELSGFLAHEFNNILTPLLAHAQLALREPRDPERMAQALARVVSGVKRATAVAESILSLASQTPDPQRGTSEADATVPRGTRGRGPSQASGQKLDQPDGQSGGPSDGPSGSQFGTPPVSSGGAIHAGAAVGQGFESLARTGPSDPPATSIRACLKEALRHFSHIIDTAASASDPTLAATHPQARTKLGRGEATESEVRVVIEATPGLAAAIAPIELEQVLMNLALNAKRAIEHANPDRAHSSRGAATDRATNRATNQVAKLATNLTRGEHGGAQSPRTITIRTGTAHPGTTHGGERVPRGTQICSASVCIDTVQRTDQSKLNPIYIRTDRARVVIEIEDDGGGFDASTLVRLGLSGFVIIEPTSPSQRDLSADGHDGSSGGARPNQKSSQHPGRAKRGGKSKEVVGASQPEPAHATSGGSGLGLEICRRIVTRAGGWIEIESAPGIGSIVRVVLPASQARGTGHAAPPGDANADSRDAHGSSHAA